LAGQLACRLAYLFQETYGTPDPRLNLKIVGLALTSSTYALALFRFRMFNLIPIARDTLVEQMPEGVLVLDTGRRIVDLNPAAERILHVSAARARGMDAFAALAMSASAGPDSEITMGAGDAARSYGVHLSPLTSRSKLPIGQLVLLRDITEPKRAQGQLVEQQRALATLRERDRVARELHDSLGQLLGYVKMQATAVRGLLQRGQQAQADACLAQLASVAQDAHADVREYIVGARTGLSANDGFLAALETYRLRFGEASGIRVNLDVQPGLTAQSLDPMVEAQLLRIIQEALTNVRKHARAHSVEIHLGAREGWAEAVVQDDGAGFDPALLEAAAGQRFGLRLMKERADEVGGGVRISSAPGSGTRVTISVPLRRELS
jgi:signal transduction histidine kinase